MGGGRAGVGARCRARRRNNVRGLLRGGGLVGAHRAATAMWTKGHVEWAQDEDRWMTNCHYVVLAILDPNYTTIPLLVARTEGSLG